MSSLPKLGNVNAAGVAKLYDKSGKLVGTCMDTPNALAWCIGTGLGAFAKGFDGRIIAVEASLIINNGWLNSATQAGYKKYNQ